VALLDEVPGVTMTVLLTGLSDEELGEDVVVRLAGRKLYAIDSWQIVKDLFPGPDGRSPAPVARLDGRPAAGSGHRGNPPPAPGGYLDAEAVWPLLLEQMIGLPWERPDLSALLRWSTAPENVQRFRRLPEEPRQRSGTGSPPRSAPRQPPCCAVPPRSMAPTRCRWGWCWG